MATVTLKDVRKYFGGHEALKGISIDIAEGEFLVLVGPSGCGKSTLLRMIAGLESITSGDISIDGRLVNDAGPRDRDIAMVFQSYALYPHKTVAENIGFSLKLRKVPKDDARRRIVRSAEMLGLSHLLERYPRQLSGGQRQRVAMGRALVRDPKVFLFDEPLSNLDAQLRVQMRAEIKELQQSLKTTSVYVTHDQVEAMTMADRIAVMRNGSLIQLGTPLEIYDRPADTFVAGFIGSPGINLLDGEVTANGGQSCIEVAGILWPIPTADYRRGQRLTLGVRPEHIRIGSSGIAATVQLVEQTGLDTVLMTRVGPTNVRVLVRGRSNIRAGETIHLAYGPEDAHLFNGETGKRL